MPTPQQRERELRLRAQIEAMRARSTLLGENAAVAAHKRECRDRAWKGIGIAMVLLSSIVSLSAFALLVDAIADRVTAERSEK